MIIDQDVCQVDADTDQDICEVDAGVIIDQDVYEVDADVDQDVHYADADITCSWSRAEQRAARTSAGNLKAWEDFESNTKSQ